MVGLEEKIIDKDFTQSYWLAVQFVSYCGMPQTSRGIKVFRDCSLYMPKGGPVFRVGGGGGGVKFSKSIKKGGVFLKYK